jgi:hypothetical protein
MSNELLQPMHDTKIRLRLKEKNSSDFEVGCEKTCVQPFQNFKVDFLPKDMQDIISSPKSIEAMMLSNEIERPTIHPAIKFKLLQSKPSK